MPPSATNDVATAELESRKVQNNATGFYEPFNQYAPCASSSHDRNTTLRHPEAIPAAAKKSYPELDVSLIEDKPLTQMRWRSLSIKSEHKRAASAGSHREVYEKYGQRRGSVGSVGSGVYRGHAKKGSVSSMGSIDEVLAGAMKEEEIEKEEGKEESAPVPVLVQNEKPEMEKKMMQGKVKRLWEKWVY